MTAAPTDLSSLSRRAGAPRSPSVPRPPSRWKTRVLLPLVIGAAVAALLGYSARDALWPTVDVWVTPVVAKPGGSGPARPAARGAGGSGPVLVQAPGWIEAAPYAVSVPALVEGVIEEILVLEGERVEAGQVVARMVDEDARLAVRRAEAELAQRAAEAEQARAGLESAVARAAEVRDEVERKRPLVHDAGFPEASFARLELRLRAMETEIAAARAAVAAAEAAVRTQEVACDEARLMLERTNIRSPGAGVVLARLVEPGTRISMSSQGGGEAGMAGGVLRLYDPSKLQVRVDVPLADAAKVGAGTLAHIVTEALPGVVLTGSVTRVVPEANIQRNTVQVKVAIDDPTLGGATLKPEMLTRVRFYPPPVSAPAENGGDAATAYNGSPEGAERLFVPNAALLEATGEKAKVWVVDQATSTAGPVALLKDVTTSPLPSDQDGYTEVTEGLRPGDRVVLDPPEGLRAGDRLRVLGDRDPTETK